MSPALSPLQRLRDERARFALVWVIPIALAGVVSFAQPILNDADTFWHIAAGRWIIAHRAVPTTDPFSFTFAGRPWLAHEWLSEVVMAGAWLAAGWSGVMLLTGLAVGALATIMGRWLLRWLSPLSALMALVLSAGCLSPGLLARPHLLVLPVLALWTVALLKARDENRAPTIWLVPLMALWANLHASFIIGLALLAALALETLLDVRRWRRDTLIGWAIVLVGSAVAMVATPHGVDGLGFPLQVLNMKTLPTITEWRAPDFMRFEPLEVILLAGLFFLSWRGAKLTAVRALVVLGLVHMSLQHIRQEVLIGVVVPLIVAEPVGRAMGALAAKPVPWRLPAPQMTLGAGLLIAAIAARLVIPEVREDGPKAPISALAAVPADLRGQPVLNAYDFGGYLIFEGVRPYIDGRADMYGDNFVAADDQIQRGDESAIAAIDHYHIRWSILEPGLPLVGVLDNTPGWKRLYADKYAVVQEKVGP